MALAAGVLLARAAAIGAPATHGVAAGDVTADSAVIWSRADRETEMSVALDPAPEAGAALRMSVRASDDYTGTIEVRGLQPSTAYRYSVWFGDDRESASEGRFRTAPAPSEPAPVSIAWTGDFAGQNVCRDAREGFPIFDAIAAEEPDLFVGLGDMIYADNKCRPTGRYRNAQVPGDFAEATDLPGFWSHWRYARADAASQRLLARTSYVGIWDDHEVVNDFGPLHDTRDTPPYTPGVQLLPDGLKAFLDYTPLARNPRTPGRLYRSLRWGRHAELFVLDGRQYRDANLAPDSAARPKTMLGREQLAWLLAGLEDSDSTWKIIVSSVPISIPTGVPPELGRDGFADFVEEPGLTPGGAKPDTTGFEAELTTILRKLHSLRARALFITTDVHFAEVFRYTPFADDPSFIVHEAVVGPGNAGVFPNRAFDRSFGPEVLFFHGPESAEAITSWEEAKRWFNYGTIAIGARGKLTLRVKDTSGKTLYELALKP